MFDQILSLVLVGLGLQTPNLPSVLGEKDLVEKRMEFKQQRIASQEANLKRKKEMRDQFKASVDAKREEAKAQFQDQREKLKQRLEIIKDETKKTQIEKMDFRLSEMNTKRTAQMTESINKIEDVLSRVDVRIEEAEASGVDVSAAKLAVADAQAKTALAKTAVSTQAAKEYVIGVTSENKLKADVSRSIEAMRQDFDAVRQVIQTAREAVTKVVKEVALITYEKS